MTKRSPIWMPRARVWSPPERGNLGFLATLGSLFASAEERAPGLFPDLRAARCLFVASDYGGEHKNARVPLLLAWSVPKKCATVCPHA